MEGIKVSQRYMRRLNETEINNYRKEVADTLVEATVKTRELLINKSLEGFDDTPVLRIL